MAEALRALVIKGASVPEEATVSNKSLLPVPALFLAVRVIWLVPELLVFPLIRPVEALHESPLGKPMALYSSGEWVASIR